MTNTADAFATFAPTGRRPRHGGDAMDAFSRSYRRAQNHDHGAGVRGAAKTTANRRERHAVAIALRSLAA